MTKNKLLRMDNIGIVVEDLKAAIAFFVELGLELEGEMTVEGQWVDRVVGLDGVRNDIAMMRTPDGHGRLELMKFQKPTATTTELNAQVNTLGIRRIMFAVKGLDDVAARLQKRGAKLVGEVVQFENINQISYRLCYLYGPEGIIIALAEQLGNKSATDDMKSKKSSLLRMDNVLIVVDDLEAVKAFFIELGLELEGETSVEGASVGRLLGLEDVRATLSMMRTPDGQGRIELDKFHTPKPIGFESVGAPVNTLGIRRIMLAVDDIDDVVARLRAQGFELVGEVVQYEDTYRLCYVRGPEGIIVALAQQLGKKSATDVLRNR
jgi:catechol 2,3-dioxygenase-like lactoylglutathione lyase family enzyme